MNKTFKVVFNKARGVMTVVNEATSSVQKKGMRTLVIATTAAIAASATWAATVNVGGAGAYIGSSQEEIVYDASAEGKISITYQDDSTTLIKANGYASADNYGAVTNLQAKQEATVNVADSVFEGNSAKHAGGAMTIFQDGKLGDSAPTHHVTGSTFKGNTASGKGGGAIAFLSDSVVAKEGTTVISGSTFEENKSLGTKDQQGGGALRIEGTAVEVTGDSSFIGNTSALNGGAIYVHAVQSDLTVDHASFTGNKADKNGGAIMLWSDGNVGGDQAFTIKNATFNDNTAAKKGGAIAWLQMETVQKEGQTLTVSDSKFTGNSALNGGAIYAEEEVIFNGETSFSSNEATENGGAIYNTDTLNFNGNATFSGNTAGGKLNDIHNVGTINVKAGTLTLDGGITGNGTLNFADNSSLAVTIGTDQATSTTISNKITVGKNVNLSMIFNPGYEGDYTLLAEKGTLEGNFIVDNVIYNITAEVDEAGQQTGAFTIEKKTVSEIAESAGVTTNQAAALNAITSKGTSTNTTYSAVAEQINTMIQSGDAAQMQAAADAVTAMSPEAAPMVSQVQTDTAAQVFNVIGSRLGSSQGMASGDGTSGTGLWVQGMVGTTDLDDTSKARGYSADTTGLALGLEAKPSDSTKVGMGFAYTNTDVDGFLRSTDVDSYTAFLYGEYKPSNWFVNGIVSYAWANYDEQKNVLGQNIGAKYDADTLGLQVMGGLDLDASGFTVTPEVGLRYYHIGTDAYTDGMGTAVSDSDEDVLTGVIGARLGKTFEVSPSMSFEPQVRLAMTYDIVDADNSSFVTLANGSSYSVEGETLDRFGIEAGVGVKAEMGDNFELSLSYEGAWRGDYQNHAGILNAKYKF